MSIRRSAVHALGGRHGLLRERDFRRLWVGETIGQFGSQVSLLAMPYIATVTLRASVFEVALLGVLQFLSFLLFTLPRRRRHDKAFVEHLRVIEREFAVG